MNKRSVFSSLLIFLLLSSLSIQKSAGITKVVVDNAKVAISEITYKSYPEVKMTVSIVDSNNNPIENLTKNDFKVFEDGIQKEILSFKSLKDSNSFTILLLLDVSGSMVGEPIKKLKESASEFIRLMPDSWKVQLINFNHEISDSGKYISDKAILQSNISEIYANGTTNLHNSLLLAYSVAKKTTTNAIVLFSDGVDTMNVEGTREKAISGSFDCKAPIYSVGFLGTTAIIGSNEKIPIDEELLKVISSNTRGRFYKTPTLADIGTLYQQISKILNNQYEIIFKSEAEGKKGDEKSVRVDNINKTTNKWISGDRKYLLPQDGIKVPILLVHGWEPFHNYSPVNTWADYISKFSLDPITKKPTISIDKIHNFIKAIDIPQTRKGFSGRKHKFWKVTLPNLPNKTFYISNYTLHETANSEWDWTQRSIKTFAQNVADEVAMILSEENVKKVDIIAHGMGGLVSRTYVECNDFGLKLFNEKKVPVRRLVMLGTPNHGVINSTLKNNIELQKKYFQARENPKKEYQKLNKNYFGNFSINEISVNSEFLNLLNYGKKRLVHDDTKIDKLNTDVQYITIAGMAYSVLDYFTYKDFSKIADLYLNEEMSDGFSRSSSVYLDGADQYNIVWSDHSGLIKKQKVFDLVREIQKSGYVVNLENYWDLNKTKTDLGYQNFLFLRCSAYMTISNDQKQEMDPFGLTPDHKKMQNVFYDFETDAYKIVNPNGKYSFHVLGTNNGNFTLTLFGNLKNTSLFYEAKNVPIKKNEMDTFTIDSSDLTKNISIQKDINNDGIIDIKFLSPNPVSSETLTKNSIFLNFNWNDTEKNKNLISGYNFYAYSNNDLTAKNLQMPNTSKSLTYPIENLKDYNTFFLLSEDKNNSWNQSISTKPLTYGFINTKNLQFPKITLPGFSIDLQGWFIFLFSYFFLLLITALILLLTKKTSPKVFLHNSNGELVVVRKLPFTIGRSSTCNLALHDLNVSKLHAVIIKQKEGYILRDLHSGNGTYINNQKINKKGLHNRDEIKIGKTILIFRIKPKSKKKIKRKYERKIEKEVTGSQQM